MTNPDGPLTQVTIERTSTPRHYTDVHRVDAVCRICDRWDMLDLDDLIRRGLGDVPLIQLPLRCAECGAMDHKIIVTGRSYPTQQPPRLPPADRLTHAHRYRRPPRKPRVVALAMPTIVVAAPPVGQGAAGLLDMAPEEHQRRGDAAEARSGNQRDRRADDPLSPRYPLPAWPLSRGYSAGWSPTTVGRPRLLLVAKYANIPSNK